MYDDVASKTREGDLIGVWAHSLRVIVHREKIKAHS
jgi:hypothetical protein